MKTNNFSRKIFNNWPAKLCCFLFAVCIVFVLRFQMYNSHQVNIPLEVRIPEGYEVVNNLDTTAVLTIRGDRKIIYMIDPSQITAVADFSVVTEAEIEESIRTGVPLIVRTTLVYDKGIVDLSEEIVLTIEPSRVRVLLREVE